jgi:hypothetical protein
MKRIRAISSICVLVLFLAAPAAGAAGSEGREPGRDYAADLTGRLWHASPVLGSSWSDRLLMEADGTFIYAASGMDGETRERFISGTWSINPDRALTLSRAVTLIWTGGKILLASGSIGTATEIANARVTETQHRPAAEIAIRVEKPVYDEEYPHPWSVVFSGGDFLRGGRWWKYEMEEDARDLRDDYAAARREAGNAAGRKQQEEKF